jgi:acyl-CoA thioesterase FadM
VKVECQFLAPNPLGDVITFELTVARLGESSITLRIAGKARGVECVRATVTVVHSALEPLKALAIPARLRAAMEPFLSP